MSHLRAVTEIVLPDTKRTREESVSAAKAKEEPVKQSFGVRAWKFVSSKTLETKLGRKMALHGLGAAGEALAKVVQTLASEHFGESRADELMKEFLKLISKTQTCISQKIFSRNEASVVAEPIHNCLFLLVVLLESEKACENAMISLFAQTLRSALQLWLTVMGTNLTEKNLKMMSEFSDAAGQVEFVTYALRSELLSNPATKKEILSHLMTLLNDFQVYLPLPQIYCDLAYCGKTVLLPQGLFSGSTFCLCHHKEIYGRIARNPSLKDFLSCDYLKEFLLRHYSAGSDNSEAAVAQRRMSLLTLEAVSAIKNFKQSVTWSKRRESTRAVMSRLNDLCKLSESLIAANVVAALEAVVSARFESEEIISLDLFDPFENKLNSFLDTDFASFTQSLEFVRFIKSTTVPESPCSATDPNSNSTMFG